MASRPGSYNLINDFGQKSDDGYVSMDPYWVIAVVHLGTPLSFSREKNASTTTDVTEGLPKSVKPMVITDDCVSLQIQNSKRSHTKSMTATLLQSEVNYLSAILPGDHVLAWMMNNNEDYARVVKAIDDGKAANGFNDGLKFVGRVHEVSKSIQVDRTSGTKNASYQLQCVGFAELDSCLFYDDSLASYDQIKQDLGQWLARLGLKIQDIFAEATSGGVPSNNINQIMPMLLDLIVGKGPPAGKDAAPEISARDATVSAMPQTLAEPPYAYIIPSMVGQLLGKDPSDASKPSRVMAYADILELLQGVQNYSSKDNDTHGIFIPDLGPSTPQRMVTETEMLGTFLPMMPQFTNRPLWQIFQQYLNPTINEMYTALRGNLFGNIVPTIVLRQIPFTTSAFQGDASTPFTRFLELPRWIIPDTMISRVQVGRSDATRVNFVHIYGASSMLTEGRVSVQYQLIQNPPIRDDIDIMRAGMRPYMTTVECFVNDQVGKAPSQWMQLVADWTIGSQYTLNGTISCLGIQSPIVEGDNVEFDNVVYHIESVAHSAQIDGAGNKSWSTTLTLTNGMQADFEDNSVHPMYAGFTTTDQMKHNPGLTLEQVATTGAPPDDDNSRTPSDNVTPNDAGLGSPEGRNIG